MFCDAKIQFNFEYNIFMQKKIIEEQNC